MLSLLRENGARDGTATSGANDGRDRPPRAGVGTGAIIGAEDGMDAVTGAEDGMDSIIGAEDGANSIIGAEDGTDSMRLLWISASFLSRTCTELSRQ